MCKYDLVIFDLDGTLLDTSEGVLSAVKYTIEAFNSIGVINYDGTGSVYDNLADEYKNKAHELEKHSYDIFAKCLYEYSKSLKLHAEHERDIY